MNKRCWRVAIATLTAIGCAAPILGEGPGTIVAPGRAAVPEGGALGLQSAQGGMSGFFVAREGGSAGAVSVDLDTVDGSALAGQDLTAYRATLTWEDGEDGIREVPLEILDDEEVEGNEWFRIRLSNVTGGAQLPRRFARVVIRDDDFAVQPPSLVAALGRNPDSATDDQGRRLIVFEAPDADGLGIYALLFSPDGDRLKGPDLVNLVQSGDQVSPKVTTAGDRRPGGPSNTLAIKNYWQRQFSVLWIDRGEATPRLPAAGTRRSSKAAGGGGTTVMRRFFGSDGGLADTTEDLGWDLSGDFWGVVAGPYNLMAAFGCNAEGFPVGHILFPAGQPFSSRGFEAEIAISETPIPDCAADDAAKRRRSTAAMEAPRQRLGAVPKQSLGPITVAYSTSGATQGPETHLTGGGLRARSFSWRGEPLGAEIQITLSTTAANVATSVSANGRMRLFWDDIGEEGDRDIFGVIADDAFSLARLGRIDGSRLTPETGADNLTAPGGLGFSTAAQRIHLDIPGDQRLAGAATNSNGDSFLALHNDFTSESGAGANVALLGLALDEDGVPVARPIPLGEAAAGEDLAVSLDDGDRAFVSFLNTAGELKRRSVQASIARGACVADEHTLCLADERYAVSALWGTDATEIGRGRSRSLTADTGTFWFFGEDNLEILLKVLDACRINRQFWVFAAGLTNVGVSLLVDDTQAGVSRTFSNSIGETFHPLLDTSAFATCDLPAGQLAAVEELGSPGHGRWLESTRRGEQSLETPCAVGTLCLGDRFEVSLDWETEEGETGSGRPVQLTADSGTFWFFDEDNLEILIKVLDACTINGRHWVFAAGLTNLGATLTVHDTATGEVEVFENQVGKPFAPIADTDAFSGCPGLHRVPG